MNNNCIICFDNKWLTNTPCYHKICLYCIIKLKKNECPLCRKKNIFNSLPKIILLNLNFLNKKKIIKNIIDINDLYNFPPLS